jgi:hypothetical protein
LEGENDKQWNCRHPKHSEFSKHQKQKNKIKITKNNNNNNEMPFIKEMNTTFISNSRREKKQHKRQRGEGGIDTPTRCRLVCAFWCKNKVPSSEKRNEFL